MRVIALRALREFWEERPDARPSLEAWYSDVREAEWRTSAEIKQVYRNASIIGDNREVFNIKGNGYRLVVAIQYEHDIVFVRFVGTHRDYDHIDAETV